MLLNKPEKKSSLGVGIKARQDNRFTIFIKGLDREILETLRYTICVYRYC